MALRVHEHVQRGGVVGVVRALPHPRVGQHLLGQRAREHPPRSRRQLGQLRERRPGTVAVHRRQRGPSDAAVDPALQRQALQVDEHADRGEGVRRHGTSAARPGRAGRRSPTTPSNGRSATPESTCDGHPHHAHRWADDADRGRRVAPASRTRRSTIPAGSTASVGARRRAKVAGPAIAVAELGPIDAILLTHDHHADNLD